MSEFKVIETQEDFDARIKERLARAEQKIKDQYADYDTYKQKASEYEKEIEKIKGEKADAENERDKLSATVKQYEHEALQVKVAREVGIPYGMATKITGDDEAAMMKDAKEMKGFLGNGPEAPLGGSGEPNRSNGDDKEESWMEFSKSLSDEV